MIKISECLWVNECHISMVGLENRDDKINQYAITFNNGDLINVSQPKGCAVDRKISALLESVNSPVKDSISLEGVEQCLELYSELNQGQINDVMDSMEKMAKLNPLM